MSGKFEDSAVISGAFRSQSGRKLSVDPWELSIEAAMGAIADAGLPVDAIDGLSTYPGPIGSTPGMTAGGTQDMKAMLGLNTRWHTGGMEMPGQLGAVINAMMAVHSGLAEHVLCFRTVWEASAQRQAGSRAKALGNSAMHERTQWTDPYGVSYPNYGALMMQRYFAQSGSTREQFGTLASVQRDNALLNPHRVFDKPLAVEDYLEDRMISDPMCLFDCDVPIDGSTAFVISRTDSRAIDAKRKVRFEAVGSSVGYEACAEMMWSRTDLTPADIGAAQLYDGWSILSVLWLEALGLCGKNEGGHFIGDRDRIGLSGDLPINTDGGQLSAGRMHGFGALFEACVQLRGEAGERQASSERQPQIVSVGAADFTSCFLVR